MKGIILSVTKDNIMIRGDDDKRYNYAVINLKSDVKPKVGDPVDFDVWNDAAQGVYILRSATTSEVLTEKTVAGAKLAIKKIKAHIPENSGEKLQSVAEKTFAGAKSGIKKAKARIPDDSANKLQVFASKVLSKLKSNSNNQYARIHYTAPSIMAIGGFLPLVAIMGESFAFFDDANYLVLFLCLAAIFIVHYNINRLFYTAAIGLSSLIFTLSVREVVLELSNLSSFLSNMSKTEMIFKSMSWGGWTMTLGLVLCLISLIKRKKSPFHVVEDNLPN